MDEMFLIEPNEIGLKWIKVDKIDQIEPNGSNLTLVDKIDYIGPNWTKENKID